MTQVNIRIDENLKAKADALFEEMGLNMTTAITMFIRQAVRESRIPFEITTKVDPFYSDSNMKVLMESISDMDVRRGIVSKAIEELEAMENE